MKKLILLITLILLVLPLVQASVIHGTVYDYELNKIDNIQVILGAEKTITQNGQYRFTVVPGTYTLEARQINRSGSIIASTNDTITVLEDKEYVLDLILFGAERNIEPPTEEPEESSFWTNFSIVAAVIILIIVIAYVRYFRWRLSHLEKSSEEKIKKTEKKLKETEKRIKKETEEKVKEGKEEKLDTTVKEVLDFIKKQGGRTTQLEIRENFPSSEAKISLIITELEHKGRIQKIKKGRGNIIILK